MNQLFRIKPLEWEPIETRWAHGFRTTGLAGRQMLVARNTEGRWYVMGSSMEAVFCASPEEGKQLAEAHWRAYIAQALIPVEDPK